MTTRPPAWAAFFSPSAYKHFVRCVEAELAARGLAYELVEGGVALKDPPIVVGLANLAQHCRASVPPRWPELVRFLLDRVATVHEEEETIRELIRSGEARARLRLRIYPHEDLAVLAQEDFVVRPFAPSLSACLAWDLPMSVSLVRRADIACWGCPETVLVETALENVWARERVERATPSASRPEIEELSGESHFAATHALLLERRLTSASSKRLLCAVPNRHTVLFAALPARDDPRPVAESLVPLVAQAFRNGPGSISLDLFWWGPGSGASAWKSFDA